MTSPSPYVTVTVQSSRESWGALLAAEHVIAQDYTPRGIAWSNVLKAVREALGENGQEAA